ncbi:MFS transporter [Agreia sp. Leaf244]|uniref:MFS transporter n=1 Tax=Agreia sp. Leaf244 TaxID=1736305 RepID=UPI000701AE32|nr:MFS transporter [Agreia sp. Leaf244]KQO06713.1 MFS transporter [Agreia sp. Leaf244]
MTSSSPAPQIELTERAKWQAFAVAVGVAALTILDLSKVNVGLPSIEKALGAGPTELQLIVAGYALAFGLALVPAGRLGDIYSRKLLFSIGLISFTLASLACALAPTVETLLIARILQGVAAGIQMPQVLGLVQQLFQGSARGRAFGIFGATIGVATAFGPTLGGLLIAVGGETDGWRLLFWMNIPLGLIALFFALRLLPTKPKGTTMKTQLDLVGILLLGLSVFSLMVPFVFTTGGPDDDPKRWFWLIGFALGTTAFLLWERDYGRRGKSPVVHFSLFRIASYRNGILVATAYFAAIPGTFLLTTLYLQQGLGALPVFAGMVSIPFALTSAASSLIGGRIVERYGRKLVVIGTATVIVGFSLILAAAVLTPRDETIWWMAAAMAVAGAGGGLVISPNQTLTLAEVPVSEGGVAGSLAQVGQRVGTAIGVAAVSSTFFATLYRDKADPDQLMAYHEGFRNGILIAISLITVSLIVGLVDLRSRAKAAKRETAASDA